MKTLPKLPPAEKLPLHQWKRQLRTLKAHALKQDRYRAELLAKLASCPSLASVTAREQRQFLGLARKTGFSFAFTLAPLRPEGEESQWTVLHHVHTIVRPFLARFLDGDPMPLQPLAACERASAQLTPAGHIQFISGDEGLQEQMLVELWRLVSRGDAFPLRLCGHCKTQVFVKVRRQQYCSVSCRNKENEAHRDPDKRRASQRKLMKARRANGKEPKRLKKKTRPSVVTRRRASRLSRRKKG